MDTLIARAKARDPEALAEIYHRYHDPLVHYITRYVHDVELAQDLTADVFVRMLEGIHRFEDRGWPIGAWLYRIAHARAVDTLRRQATRATCSLEPWHKLIDGPEAATIRSLEYAELQALLGDLTRTQRRVLELRFWEELDVRGTAATIGTTEGAVKALQHRAVDALSQRMVV